MSHTYGFVKCKVVSAPALKASRQPHEIQYHLHSQLRLDAADGTSELWDSAVNVGTNDADDLLQYKLVFDYGNPLLAVLKAAPAGFTDLTGTAVLPALDFLRSDVLNGTGAWRPSDVMDGSEAPEPVASLLRMLERARANDADVYIFGRTYTGGDLGVHDVHMNQGSQGRFLNHGTDANDHNDIWQDGAVLVDFGESEFAAYFTAFTQQLVPTDALGNPTGEAHPIADGKPRSTAATTTEAKTRHRRKRHKHAA